MPRDPTRQEVRAEQAERNKPTPATRGGKRKRYSIEFRYIGGGTTYLDRLYAEWSTYPTKYATAARRDQALVCLRRNGGILGSVRTGRFEFREGPDAP